VRRCDVPTPDGRRGDVLLPPRRQGYGAAIYGERMPQGGMPVLCCDAVRMWIVLKWAARCARNAGRACWGDNRESTQQPPIGQAWAWLQNEPLSQLRR